MIQWVATGLCATQKAGTKKEAIKAAENQIRSIRNGGVATIYDNGMVVAIIENNIFTGYTTIIREF